MTHSVLKGSTPCDSCGRRAEPIHATVRADPGGALSLCSSCCGCGKAGMSSIKEKRVVLGLMKNFADTVERIKAAEERHRIDMELRKIQRNLDCLRDRADKKAYIRIRSRDVPESKRRLAVEAAREAAKDHNVSPPTQLYWFVEADSRDLENIKELDHVRRPDCIGTIWDDGAPAVLAGLSDDMVVQVTAHEVCHFAGCGESDAMPYGKKKRAEWLARRSA